MANDINRSIKITLDHSDMKTKLSELEDRSGALTKKLQELNAAGEGQSTAAQNIQKSLDKCTAEMEKQRAKVVQTEKVLKNLSGSTYKELAAVKKQLTAELQNETRGTEAYKKKCEQLARVQTEMKTAQTEMSSSMQKNGGFMASLSLKTAALAGGFMALGSRIVDAAADLFSWGKVVNSTQAAGDKWAERMAGVHNAVESVRIAISTGDWSNWVSNMVDAYLVAKDVAHTMDEIFERENSLTLTRAKSADQLITLRETMKDVTKGDAERLAAAEEYQRVVDEFTKEEVSIARQKYDAQKKLFTERTKLNDEELEAVTLNYNANRKMIRAVEELRDMEKSLAGAKTALNNAQDATEIATWQDEVKATTAALEELQKTAGAKVLDFKAALDKYDKGTDDTTLKYIESYANYLTVAANARREMLKITTQQHTLEKSISDKAAAAASAAKTAKEKTEQEAKAKMNKDAEAEQKAETEGLAAAQKTAEARAALFLSVAKNQKEINEKELTEEEAFVLKIEQKYAALTASLREALASGLITWDEYNSQILALQNARADEQLQHENEAVEKVRASLKKESEALKREADRVIADQGNGNLSAEYQMELDQLTRMHEEGYLSEQQYQKAIFKLKVSYAEKYAESSRQILSAAQGVSDGLQDYALAQVEARYQQEIAAAGDNEEEKERITEEYEQKKLDVQKRYADVNFGIQVANIVVDTSVAVMKAWAELGPIAAGIMTPAIMAMGALQVATANEERKRVKAMTLSGSSSSSSGTSTTGDVMLSGYSEGGPTGKGGILEPAGIVHRGEYVVPAWQMRDPDTIDMVRVLEAKRKAGRASQTETLPGFAAGGATDIAAPASSSAAGSAELTKALAALNATLGKGVHAFVVISELEEQQKRLEKSRKGATK